MRKAHRDAAQAVDVVGQLTVFRGQEERRRDRPGDDELADINVPPDRIEPILSCDIYQRHVIVGPVDRSRAGGSVTGLTTCVIRNGEETASNSVLEANTGKIVTIVRHVADVLARCGEGLKAGEFIIAGSITPPLFLTAEDRELTHDIEGLGSVSVRFEPA